VFFSVYLVAFEESRTVRLTVIEFDTEVFLLQLFDTFQLQLKSDKNMHFTRTAICIVAWIPNVKLRSIFRREESFK